EDLLRRKPIKFKYTKEMLEKISNKTILVTGAAGSVGSELTEQLCGFNIKKLICLDFAESALFELENNLLELNGKIDKEFILTDLRDRKIVDKIISKYQPDFIFHAAAYKHVPILERNPEQAILNNLVSMKNLLESAVKYNVSTLILISTDKAVDPSSVMGMSKSLNEYMLHAFACQTSARFLAVRFGNVLESNGSVIPVFKKQIEKGGPVTITDEKMTRYFMTRMEAAQLVIQSAIIGHNDCIYVLNMGEPYSIILVAKDLIRLYGYRPDIDIKIKVIGAREGEKMEEKLFKSFEKKQETKNSYIYEVVSSKPDPETILSLTDDLVHQIKSDLDLLPDEVKKMLTRTIEKLEEQL
ncbi:MAG: polysaccharide biosynthesis protein, partial [Candidatus Thorarchaeota archaeon]